MPRPTKYYKIQYNTKKLIGQKINQFLASMGVLEYCL